MKRQFLHEAHNLQDKAKKPEYHEGIREQGDNFDRGGVSERKLLSFRGSKVYLDLRPSLAEDKESLIEMVGRHLKFAVNGEVGTIPQLMRKLKTTEFIRERHEMTRNSILRAADIVDVVKHPKKNSQFRLLEFTCFLQPVEPFPNPIFKRHFAFRLKLADPKA